MVNIVLAAEESAGIQVLRLVTSAGHRVSAVLTSAPEGARGATVAAVAEGLGIEVLPAKLVTDPAFAEHLRAAEVDLLLNIHSLHIADPHVIAAPRIGSFNLHPGQLPQYAGLNVPSWAIYRGEPHHGVTLHWMAPKVDAGRIAFQASFPITPSDTGLSLTAKCVRHGLPLVSALLAQAARDPVTIPAVSQDLSLRRYFGRKVPHGGLIPWERPARQVVDFIRACDYSPWRSPWGEPRTYAGDLQVTMSKASMTEMSAAEPPGTVGSAADRGLLVAAADEWVLVTRIHVGDRRMDPRAALAAVKPGTRLRGARDPAGFPLDNTGCSLILTGGGEEHGTHPNGGVGA
ncbi:MAG: methionyl-tRNA formyltransferase [Egibacteraceae bacterium]